MMILYIIIGGALIMASDPPSHIARARGWGAQRADAIPGSAQMVIWGAAGEGLQGSSGHGGPIVDRGDMAQSAV